MHNYDHLWQIQLGEQQVGNLVGPDIASILPRLKHLEPNRRKLLNHDETHETPRLTVARLLG